METKYPGIAMLILALGATLCAAPARAQSVETAPAAVVLDRARVIALARAQAPEVRVAEARVGEARALHTGALALATVNPEVGLSAGPRWGSSPNASVAPDVALTLTWPVDFSGARHARVSVADELTRAAEADAADAQRRAIAEALALWARVLAADARIELETERAALDASVAHIAQARRAAGTAGDGDVALANILRAQGEARLRQAQGERAAQLALLLGRLGIAGDSTATVAGDLAGPEPEPLPALLARVPARPDVLRALENTASARADEDLQRRLAAPVPRWVAAVGRDDAYYARVGVDVALPVYARNQANVAVAVARGETGRREHDLALARAASEVRSAHARWLAARDALASLDAALASIADVEHLAERAYELGQTDLAATVTAFREAAAARAARLDATLAVALARIDLDLASGTE